MQPALSHPKPVENSALGKLVPDLASTMGAGQHGFPIIGEKISDNECLFRMGGGGGAFDQGQYLGQDM